MLFFENRLHQRFQKSSFSLLFCKNLSFPFLVACMVFWKRMPLGSDELSLVLRPFFNKRLSARLSLRFPFLSHLDDQEKRKKEEPWDKKEHWENKRKKEGSSKKRIKEEKRTNWTKRKHTEFRIEFETTLIFHGLVKLGLLERPS